MGYLHINNLYKTQDILLFKECFALEKIHGSSAHIGFKNSQLHFFSGGEKHERFISLFNQDSLVLKFTELGLSDVIVFGEIYGGKCQGMSGTYGKDLKFIAFDIKIGDSWLSVPQAEELVIDLGLEFVDYVKILTDLESLDRERDKDSIQAIRNGCGEGKIREGVILRPLIELTKNNGERVIAKHKREEFSERATPQKVVDSEKLKVLSEAKEIAEEWVTFRRLEHVLQRVPDHSMRKIPVIIKTMLEDVIREGEGEIIFSPAVSKAINNKTVEIYKNYFKKLLQKNS